MAGLKRKTSHQDLIEFKEAGSKRSRFTGSVRNGAGRISSHKRKVVAVTRINSQRVEINKIPSLKTEKLEVYAFGTGSMCELGLGPDSKSKEVKRPRKNVLLLRDKVGIVDLGVGGAHSLVIDYKGRVWSWGGNDHGVLGRDTNKEGAEILKDMDDDDSDDEDGDLNPYESVPDPVEGIPANVKIVQVVGTDNLSVALTSHGQVYAWGTFRCNEGILGFSQKVQFQRTPKLIKDLNKIAQIAAGKDHILALTAYGTVYSWGSGQQYQLGRKVMERTRLQTLTPREFGLKNIVFVGSGEYHSFAIDSSGRVMSWGLNQFGQCGIPTGIEDNAIISGPTYIDLLDGKNIVAITGGEHHSLALSKDGKVYAFGRIDSYEVGIPKDKIPEYAVRDAQGRARCIPEPTELTDLPKIRSIACGSHHSLAISDTDGSVYSWGFGETYQVGHGPSGGDIEVPTKIENTATRGVDMKFIGAGGQFSIIAGTPPAEN